MLSLQTLVRWWINLFLNEDLRLSVSQNAITDDFYKLKLIYRKLNFDIWKTKRKVVLDKLAEIQNSVD